MPIFIALVLFLGGGLSLAADSAAPGGKLYGFKTVVNEGVLRMLSFSDASRAALSGKLAVRRLEEAEALAAEGRLDADATGEINRRFKVEADGAMKRFGRLKKAGGLAAVAKLESDFEITLRAHEEVLSALAARQRSPDGIGSVLASARARIVQAELARTDTEQKLARLSGMDKAAADEGRKAEELLLSSSSFIEARREELGAETIRDADASLAAARSAMREGGKKLRREEYDEAFASFQNAGRLAQETRLSVGILSTLNLNKPSSAEDASSTEVRRRASIDLGATAAGGRSRALLGL